MGLLLQRKDLNPNTPDAEYGQTPLQWAAQCWYARIVRSLLEREDIHPNIPDSKFGKTPLREAVLLLEREDINPNTLDTKSGQAPLLAAASHGSGVAITTEGCQPQHSRHQIWCSTALMGCGSRAWRNCKVTIGTRVYQSQYSRHQHHRSPNATLMRCDWRT